MGLHDGAAVFGHKLAGGGALVSVPDYLLLVKDKVVGIDVSTLHHGLCQSNDIQQMQAVDPRNSVVYPVANLLNTYFKAKALDQARSVIAVFDPKRLNCHHCGQCQETYEAAYATKCDITGRDSRGVAAAAATEAYTKALATYNEATDCTDDTHSARNIEGADNDPLKQAFDTWVKAADTCTSSVEEAVRHFFAEWNVKVTEARALATKGGGGGVALPAKSQTENWAKRPLIHCVASPVEADDQLAYFVRCGLVDLVISVDTDFICMRGLPLLATKSAISRVKYGSSLRQYSKDSVIARARVLFGMEDDDECDLDTASRTACYHRPWRSCHSIGPDGDLRHSHKPRRRRWHALRCTSGSVAANAGTVRVCECCCGAAPAGPRRQTQTNHRCGCGACACRYYTELFFGQVEGEDRLCFNTKQSYCTCKKGAVKQCGACTQPAASRSSTGSHCM